MAPVQLRRAIRSRGNAFMYWRIITTENAAASWGTTSAARVSSQPAAPQHVVGSIVTCNGTSHVAHESREDQIVPGAPAREGVRRQQAGQQLPAGLHPAIKNVVSSIRPMGMFCQTKACSPG